MKKIRDISIADRPREKLKYKGVASLSDLDLLQALIGSGNRQASVSQIAAATKKVLQREGADVAYGQLEHIIGLGNAKITEILAAFELSKRYLIEADAPVLDSSAKVAEQCADIRNKKQEYFICLTLDGANRLLSKRTISIGTLTTSLVHPREVYADAIVDRAAGIIVAHNHPSGNLAPSAADEDITVRLRDVGQLLGIELVDHLILSSGGYKSIELNLAKQG